MHRYYIRVLLTLAALSNHAFCSLGSAEGSWFDGMEFEEYHPPKNEQKPAVSDQNFWRIPCGLILEGTDPILASNVWTISTLVDQNLSSSTITESFLQSTFGKEELSELMIQDQSNGTYLIPTGSIWLRLGSTEATVLAPTLQVVQETDHTSSKNGSNPLHEDAVNLRLGMDFLSMYEGRLDADGEGGVFLEVNHDGSDQVGSEEVFIPFWQPRSSIAHEDL